jgi:stage II sporulation protein AB (anti-sigma F factor)
MKRIINEMKLRLRAESANEAVARACISAFVADADPTVEELCDIRCAVSEAVTNAIVHGYKDSHGRIYIDAALFSDNTLKIKIRDKGCGIEDVKKAMEPLYTTAGDDRSGLGFCVMESFTDKVSVRSTLGKGTTVTLTKKITGKCE